MNEHPAGYIDVTGVLPANGATRLIACFLLVYPLNVVLKAISGWYKAREHVCMCVCVCVRACVCVYTCGPG